MRCIKPNEDKVAGRLDEEHCRHQVAYLGLLENVRVRRAGFASRQPYSRFLLRYGAGTPGTAPRESTVPAQHLPRTDVFREWHSAGP